MTQSQHQGTVRNHTSLKTEQGSTSSGPGGGTVVSWMLGCRTYPALTARSAIKLQCRKKQCILKWPQFEEWKVNASKNILQNVNKQKSWLVKYSTHTTHKSYMSVWMSARTNMNASYEKQDQGTQDIVSTKITSMIESVKQTKYHHISNCHLPEKLSRLSLPCAQQNCSKREVMCGMRTQGSWSSAPKLHKPGVVVSACNLSTWEVKSEDQKFKVILTRLWDLFKGKNKKKK